MSNPSILPLVTPLTPQKPMRWAWPFAAELCHNRQQRKRCDDTFHACSSFQSGEIPSAIPHTSTARRYCSSNDRPQIIFQDSRFSVIWASIFSRTGNFSCCVRTTSLRQPHKPATQKNWKSRWVIGGVILRKEPRAAEQIFPGAPAVTLSQKKDLQASANTNIARYLRNVFLPAAAPVLKFTRLGKYVRF